MTSIERDPGRSERRDDGSESDDLDDLALAVSELLADLAEAEEADPGPPQDDQAP